MLNEADYDMTESAMGPERGSQSKGDDALLVRFYTHPRENLAESRKTGIRQFKDTEYIEIIAPGCKDNIIRRPSNEFDKRRFPKHYAAYKNDQGELIEGTPLHLWPGAGLSQVEHLKYQGVRTVEQLAAMPDSSAQNFMGGAGLKARAQQFVEDNAVNAPIAELRDALNSTKAENEALKVSLNALTATVHGLQQAQAVQAGSHVPTPPLQPQPTPDVSTAVEDEFGEADGEEETDDIAEAAAASLADIELDPTTGQKPKRKKRKTP